jgi:hypothetical protein
MILESANNDMTNECNVIYFEIHCDVYVKYTLCGVLIKYTKGAFRLIIP